MMHLNRRESLIITLSAFILVISFSSINVNAYGVWTSNLTGGVKRSFYDNEYVYVTSGNITNESQEVYLYVVENYDTWLNGTVLSSLSQMSAVSVTTNSTGHIPIRTLWETPVAGEYDIILSLHNDGVYNSSIDYVNGTNSTMAFKVEEAPIPTLSVSEGANNPEDHSWDLENDTGYNYMLQLNLSAGKRRLEVNYITIEGNGTGNDKEDVTVAYLIYDSNSNGEYDQGESILDYGDYTSDDGLLTFEIEHGQTIEGNESEAMLIAYSMSASGGYGNTYSFDVISITAKDSFSEEGAEITGLPVESAITTISAESSEATTVETTTIPATTSTTTIPTNECDTDEDCDITTCNNKEKTTYTCEYNNIKEVNECVATITDVECCGDGDCEQDYYCLDYACVEKETEAGGWLSGGLGGRNFNLTLISIGVVFLIAIIIFFFIKNRNNKPWKSGKDYNRKWNKLKEKWEEK